jgi:hypothetical protein
LNIASIKIKIHVFTMQLVFLSRGDFVPHGIFSDIREVFEVVTLGLPLVLVGRGQRPY